MFFQLLFSLCCILGLEEMNPPKYIASFEDIALSSSNCTDSGVSYETKKSISVQPRSSTESEAESLSWDFWWKSYLIYSVFWSLALKHKLLRHLKIVSSVHLYFIWQNIDFILMYYDYVYCGIYYVAKT